MAFKKYEPYVRFNGEKLDADELNVYQQYTIACPGTAYTAIGTAAGGSSTQSKTLVVKNQQVDFPRNLVFNLVTTAGSLAGGTLHIVGKDQWGNDQTEDIIQPEGTTNQSIAGSKIFSKVTAGTVSFGTSSQINSTTSLGYACGTAAGSNVFQFGLPWRLGAKSDIKSITYAKNFVPTVLNEGTPSNLITLDPPSFTGTVELGTADFFTVRAIPTYNGEALGELK